MNPIEVVQKQDPSKTVGWACGKCGILHTTRVYAGLREDMAKDAAVRSATECCDRRCDCGEPASDGWTVCKACRLKNEAAKEAALYEKAKKVPLAEYTEPFVFLDGCYGNDGYVHTDQIDDALDEELEEGVDRPAYAWACSPNPASFNLADALDSHVGDNHHDGAAEAIDATSVAAAQALVDAALKGIVSYEVDYSTAVLIPAKA